MAATTLIIGTSNTVHACEGTGTACGLGRSGNTRTSAREVTCKTCLRKLAEIPTPAQIKAAAVLRENRRVALMRENRLRANRQAAVRRARGW